MPLYDQSGKFTGGTMARTGGGLYDGAGNLRAAPAEKPKSFGDKVKGFFADLGSGLISSEQKAGEDISSAISLNVPGVQDAISKANQANAELGSVFGRLIQKRHEMFLAGKDTKALDGVIREDAKVLNISNINEILPVAAKKSDGQILGDFGGVALDVLSSGQFGEAAKATKAVTTGEKLAQVAKTTGKAAATGGALGYSYDVSQNLQEGQTGTKALRPGWATVAGTAIPLAFGAFNTGKIAGQAFADRIDNSLIRPLPKQFRYGANPGRTMAEMGITANSWDELGSKVGKASGDVGKEIGALGSTLQEKSGGATLNLVDNLHPIDSAIRQAAANNDTAVVERLQKIRQALTEDLVAKTGADGSIVIHSNGPRNLENATFGEGLEFQRKIGKLTKWTGAASDDKTVNMALKRVYGGVRESMQELAQKIDPATADAFTKANQRFADLQTAEIAIKHQNELRQGRNLVSMPIKVGGAAGIITAIATGGAALPAILASVGAAALDKALESPAAKTRMAAWLAKTSPATLQAIYAKNPAIRAVILKVANSANQ